MSDAPRALVMSDSALSKVDSATDQETSSSLPVALPVVDDWISANLILSSLPALNTIVLDLDGL